MHLESRLIQDVVHPGTTLPSLGMHALMISADDDELVTVSLQKDLLRQP